MPEHWATEDDGYLRLCVAKGTLVPAKTLRCGHPQACCAPGLLVSPWLNLNSNPCLTPRPRPRTTTTTTTTDAAATLPSNPLTPNPLTPNCSTPRQASAKRRKLEQCGMSDPAAMGMHMHVHMGESGMHMPMGAHMGIPMGMPMGMPGMHPSNYSPAARRPGAPVKIVWSVEEDQQLLQVLCMLHLGCIAWYTTGLILHCVRSCQGAPAAAPGPLHDALRPPVLSCLLPPSPLAAGAHDRAALVGGRRAASRPRWQAVPRTVRHTARCLALHSALCSALHDAHCMIMWCIT